jgi:hypothetical protein
MSKGRKVILYNLYVASGEWLEQEKLTPEWALGSEIKIGERTIKGPELKKERIPEGQVLAEVEELKASLGPSERIQVARFGAICPSCDSSSTDPCPHIDQLKFDIIGHGTIKQDEPVV